MKKNGIVYINDVLPSMTNIKDILTIRKERNLDRVFFVVEDEEYEEVVRLIIQPYRKLVVLNKKGELLFKDNSEEINIDITYDFNSYSKPVKRYIVENGIDTLKLLEQRLSEKRLVHVKSVADLAVRMARGNGLDERKAYVAGLWHDIAKEVNKDDLKWYMDNYYPEGADLGKEVWHQFVAERILKHDYQFRDKEILKAVRHHCLGDDDSLLSMVIFCADKLDPTRGYDSSKEIELCCKDIIKGFKLVHEQQYEFLKERGIVQ